VANVTAGPTDVLVLDEDNSVFQLPNWDTVSTSDPTMR
jgi:hypothetical protein